MTVTPPVKIVIDFLDGITSKKDAVAYARGFIESHFDVPALSGFYTMRFGNGYVYEAHEGGSQRAYLPRILKIIEDNPTATVSVRAGKRVLQVSRGPRDSFNAVLLPEELSSYLENVIDPEEEGPALTPYEIPNMAWLVAGIVIAFLGALIFLICAGMFVTDQFARKPAEFVMTPADKLPMRQWDTILKSLQPGYYIAAMRYQDGNWQVDVKKAEVNPEAVKSQPAAKPQLPQQSSVPKEQVSKPAIAPVNPAEPIVPPLPEIDIGKDTGVVLVPPEPPGMPAGGAP